MTSATSITAFLIRRSVFFSILGFLAIFFIATRAYQAAVEENAEGIADTIAKSTFNAMYLVMSQGWNRSQLDTFMEELEQGNERNNLNLSIYRGEPVTRLYGPIEQPPFDDQMLQVMKSGSPILEHSEEKLRYLYPLLAERRCQACHTNVEVGDTLGLIEVKQNIKPQIARAQAMLASYLLMIAPVPLLFAWLAIRQIRLQMNRSVGALREEIQQVETIADLPEFEMPKSRVQFSELQSIFSQVQSLGEKLRGIAVDRDLLEFEIRLLEKFVITSEVVRDWREYVNELMLDINKVIHTHTMFSIFKVDDEQFDLEVFWLGPPSERSRLAMEQAILKRLQQPNSPFSLGEIKVRHNVSLRDGEVVELDQQQIELQTKSLVVEAPKIGGIVGVGVQAEIMRDDTRKLVLESILSTLLNVVGSVKAIYKYTRDLEYYATRDPLTNLYNQRMFWELLDYELDRAGRHDYSVALLLVDLDNFKSINDGYGHAAGDRLLAQFAETLNRELDSGDIICRYGGDEFVVVLPEADMERASKVSEQLMEVIHSVSLDHDGTELKVTGSVGVGVYPEHADNRKDLFLFVDNLMYRAKASGKDCVSLPQDEDLVDIFKDMTEKTLLVNRAIEEQSLVPVFQPIMAVASGEVTAVEVLSRIELAEGGLMSAGEFIEIAESMGKIHLLDYIVMDKAFAHAQQVNYQGLLFINLSPRAVVVADFLPRVKAMAETHRVDPDKVVFEITERDSVKNLSVLEQFVMNLKDYGFKLAIDDFGSGFSSFHYLKHFPIDFVKIEGEFIANMANDRRDMAFVNSIAKLSQELNVETVAEFVESDEVLQMVVKAGITYAQGYHIGRPARQIPARILQPAEPA
ncbi:putative bifunctional diguanylate cyclase/phosphodiesterase [Marinobacterium arenosum]|uniref:putative bifunctional diguanylate cyclase/phosphodiesterase n=1 Tax=Marinobacterium arenosum TaxID=2862496 RepID=UPI001C948330|nr:bifunctional diguanylate cyclase/phosphodiesterase [Marinobacterium arenosum]MBY4678748.1 bifunctional diguanylate cyclase/phosphodiesterase [Marinobacterium arenosum]